MTAGNEIFKTTNKQWNILTPRGNYDTVKEINKGLIPKYECVQNFKLEIFKVMTFLEAIEARSIIISAV